MTSPVIAFGLQAQTVALKARTGRLRWRDQVELARAALEWVPDQAPARAMVVDFLTHCLAMPEGAGEKLQRDLTAWLDDVCPPDPGAALRACEFDWQSRADLQ